MSKILLVGNGPLPSDQTKMLSASGLRTWQFTQGLLSDGHRVSVVCISDQIFEEKKTSFPRIILQKKDKNLLKKLQLIYKNFSPDAIVGVNTYPSFIATHLKSDKPFWADLNGWIMAEAQSQAGVLQSNELLPHYATFEKRILLRADKISTVSIPQQHVTVGELAMLGRLTAKNNGYAFVHPIANVTDNAKSSRAGKIIVRGKSVPKSAEIILWSGGYNTWADVETLFLGLELAMKNNGNLYFISSGGAIKGLDDRTFLRFEKMVEKSKYRKRFIFLGWIPLADLPSLYAEANLGISVDKIIYETEYGARNRINAMVDAGLPVISTLGSEVANELYAANAICGVTGGDAVALSKGIEKFFILPQKARKSLAQKAKKYMEARYTFITTTAPLRAWAKAPMAAPDRKCVDLDKGKMSIYADSLFGNLKREGVWKTVAKINKRR